MSNQQIILKLSCHDQIGVVAKVSNHFAEHNFNIIESSQFEDPDTSLFFMRTVLENAGVEVSMDDIREQFEPVAESLGMRWQIHDRQAKPKVLIAVSNWGHCLNAMLNAWRNQSLPVDVVGVVSNHRIMESMTEWYGLPFHYLPVEPGHKAEQEAQLLQVYRNAGADLLVLARYMQILSPDLCDTLAGRIINIHHSFLPGFVGARPYHQAYHRGVKQIGATAHYVTADLDQGPIIEQAVERVSHANSPQELTDIGRDIEAMVLNRAVKWHAEHRVLINGVRTVVFNR